MTPAPMSEAMLRMPHHGCAAERCSQRFSHVSRPPGALRGIVIALHRRLALALRPGESRHVAALVGFSLRGAQLPQILARAFRIDRKALALRTERLPRRELLFLRTREITLEHIHVRANV